VDESKVGREICKPSKTRKRIAMKRLEKRVEDDEKRAEKKREK
jgi:hypothetical protein